MIYTYVEDGVRHYLSRKPAGVRPGVPVISLHYVETCNFCVPGDGLNVTTLTLDRRSYRQEIEAAARTWGVDQALVRAVIHAESAFRPDAISSAGAQGLMQLMPTTALRFGINDPFNPAQNIRGGVQYLAWLLAHFGGSLDLALAGYNAGEAAVARYNGVPPYEETQAYISRVKALTQRYQSGN